MKRHDAREPSLTDSLDLEQSPRLSVQDAQGLLPELLDDSFRGDGPDSGIESESSRHRGGRCRCLLCESIEGELSTVGGVLDPAPHELDLRPGLDRATVPGGHNEVRPALDSHGQHHVPGLLVSKPNGLNAPRERDTLLFSGHAPWSYTCRGQGNEPGVGARSDTPHAPRASQEACRSSRTMARPSGPTEGHPWAPKLAIGVIVHAS